MTTYALELNGFLDGFVVYTVIMIGKSIGCYFIELYVDLSIADLQAIANWGLPEEKLECCYITSMDDVLDFINQLGATNVVLNVVRRKGQGYYKYTYRCASPLGSPFYLVIKTRKSININIRV